MGNWFYLDVAGIWWYMPDMSDRVITRASDGYFVLSAYSATSGPYESLEAAQAAYLCMIEDA